MYKSTTKTNKNYKLNRFRVSCTTVNYQRSGIFHGLGAVARPAGVVAGIVAIHGVDGQDVDFLANFGGGHAVVLVDGIVIEQPVDVHGQVALRDGALHGHRVAKVRWLVPKLEGRYMRRHLRSESESA